MAAAVRADAPDADLPRKASAALNDGLYPLAEQYLVRYLAANSQNPGAPESRQALDNLCLALARQQRYADIIGLLDKNADIVAPGDDRAFIYWRAYALLETNEPVKALDLIDPAARLAAKTNDIPNLHLLQLAAEAYFRLETPDGTTHAEELVDAFLASAPASAPSMPPDAARLLKARILLRRDARDAAYAAFASLATNDAAAAAIRAKAIVKLIDLCEADPSAALGFADLLARLPLGKSATDFLLPCGQRLASRPATLVAGAHYLKKAIRENPTSPAAPEAQFALAEAWLSAQSNDLAATEFRTYLETYGTTPLQTARATAGRAEALYRLGDFNNASTLFQKAAQTTASVSVATVLEMRAADALYADGNYESAAVLYRAARERLKTDIPAFDIDSRALILRLYHDAAPGEEPVFYANRARFLEADCLERCGQGEAAQELFSTLAASTGPFAECSLYRSALLNERQGGDIESADAAIAGYTRLIATTTNEELKCQAFLGRGRCHYRRKSLHLAIGDFSNAEKGGFDSADEAELYHVYALYALGQDEKAIQRAEEFTAHSSASNVIPTLSLWLAQYRYNEREFDKSRALFLAFASRWPNDSRTPLAMLWASKASLRLSDNQGAVEILAALSKRSDADSVLPEARYIQATALCNLARFEDAVLVLDDATAKYPASDFVTRSLILKGDAIFSLFGSAKSSYGATNAMAAYDIAATRADATTETRLECYFKRARCLEKAGDQTAADHYYDDVIAPFYALAESGEVSPASISFYERAVFACAQLKERQGHPEGAIGILRRLVKYGTPERELALREIERLQNARK